ncbi:hypothetical protein CRYUN_Cryun24cG0110200 [Craigia yunnanensis]
MPGLAMDAMNGESRVEEPNNAFYTPYKDIFTQERSSRNALSPQSQHSDSIDLAIDGVVETSVEQLYHNVYEMQSSDQSPSMTSYGSYGEESRIDSELCHLVGDFGVVEITKEVVAEKKEEDSVGNLTLKKENVSNDKKSVKKNQTQGVKYHSRSQLDSEAPRNFALLGAKFQNETGDSLEKTFELALRATKSFEKCVDGKPSLELIMSLHVLAVLHYNLGQYNEAIPIIEHSIEIPVIEVGQTHALAKFAGCIQVLGGVDPRVSETCRYIAEAHVQALQFDEAEKLCQMALDIHMVNGAPASIEEVADKRLMGVICDSNGDYKSALEHYILASMAMTANSHELDVGSIDCSIEDAYLSLTRFDEAIFAYQKALIVFKSAKGENHATVASIFVCLADLYNRIGKLRDFRTYCENALWIYEKPNPESPQKRLPVVSLTLLLYIDL